MHDLIHGLGIISMIIIIIYLGLWFDRRSKPSEFDLIRNHLQRIKYPQLNVKGHGKYFIEYKIGNDHFYYYYHLNDYNKWLAHYKEVNDIKILSHGLSGNRTWEKW